MSDSNELESEYSGDDGAVPSRIGHLIEGYVEVLELIGHGASGSVFRGRHQRLERDVAVKIMHSSLIGNPENLMLAKLQNKLTALDT